MKRPLRLALYTDAKGIGGAERSLTHLASALSPEIELSVLGVHDRVVGEVASGRSDANSVVLPFVRTRYDAPAIGAHLRALVRLKPDVFHANLISPWAGQMAIFLALLVPGIRVVAVEQLPSPPKNETQRRLKRLTAKRLSAHVAVGESSAREIERLLGLRAGSVRTIHNGVPDFPRRSYDRRVNSLPVIGAIGRFEPQKGFDVLLRALPRVPEAHVVLVGDGAERERLELLAGELGIHERVHWHGWSDESRVYLPTFDVFALPSRFEGFPLVVLEAMLAELPVVASDVGSVAEAVLDGQTGLLVPPDDPDTLARALRELLKERGRRRAMGAQGRSLVLERFTAQTMARSFESLYDEICS
jgi:glycosyltransferase involved in cell wall biosynthesis